MEYNRVEYCARCKTGIDLARKRVTRDIEPTECFIQYQGDDEWLAIAGTGCAHWVAHELRIQKGDDDEKCLLGYTFRVKALIQGLNTVELVEVQSGDIYVAPTEHHTGLVVGVRPQLDPFETPEITICHDSSRQNGVVINDSEHYFHSQGTFRR